jgi:hypothetical protein
MTLVVVHILKIMVGISCCLEALGILISCFEALVVDLDNHQWNMDWLGIPLLMLHMGCIDIDQLDNLDL